MAVGEKSYNFKRPCELFCRMQAVERPLLTPVKCSVKVKHISLNVLKIS